MNNKKLVAERIKKSRERLSKFRKVKTKKYFVLIQKPMTQKEFAKRLGFSPGYISDLEKGKKSPSPRFLKTLELTFGVSQAWILHGFEPSRVDFKERLETILSMIKFSFPPLSSKEIDAIIEELKELSEKRREMGAHSLEKEWEKELKKLKFPKE